MRGASRTSLAEVRERLETVAAAIADAAGLAALAEGLREVIRVLDREHTLRRTLSDPALPAGQRSGLVRSLLDGKVGTDVLEVTDAAVRARWARGRDLPDALETLAVLVEVIGAERTGRLDDLEDELFRFGRIVDGQPALRSALADPRLPADRKQSLLDELLSGKVTEVTLRLITEVVVHPRGRSLDRGLVEYGRIAAEHRRRLVALVRTAVPLAEEQRNRLAQALSAAYGHEIHLNIEVDENVVGGMSVQIGDEVIDGTVAGRLGDVRRRLAGP